MSCSFTKQGLAQLDLFRCEHEIGVRLHTGWLFSDLEERCLFLVETTPWESDELHIPHSVQSSPSLLRIQADYAGIKFEGPFKGGDYLY